MTKSGLSLRTLQRWFVAEITRVEAASGVTELARSRRVERRLTRGPEQSAAERLRIYRDGYVARLTEALSDDYPALHFALGDTVFEELARDYIDRHPSRSFSLNAYGRNMSELCEQRQEAWAKFAADLARLEWALVEVVHEATFESLTPQRLASLSEAELSRSRLVPNPALRVLSFEHPVNAFFQAFREDAAPARPAPAPTAVAVHRSGLALWRMPLDPSAACLLSDLVAGSSLESAISSLERRAQSDALRTELLRRLPEWLGAWMQSGFFVDIAPPRA